MLYKRKASSPQAAYGSKAPSPVPAPLLRAVTASQPVVSEVGHLSVRSSTGELCSYSCPGTSAVGKHTSVALIKKNKEKKILIPLIRLGLQLLQAARGAAVLVPTGTGVKEDAEQGA